MTKEKMCGIYCIENLIDNKKYIGLSSDIDKRLKKHKRLLKSHQHPNDHLQSAWCKYGEVNFEFKIIELCDKEILDKKEIYYINYFNTQNNMYGYNRTSGGEGVKDLDFEALDKLSVSKTQYAVVQLSLNGDFICEYRNCKHAADAVGGDSEAIRICCNKKKQHKTSCGYIWMYKEDYEQNGCNPELYRFVQYTKPIVQYDLDMNFIAEYESAREAEKITGIGYRMISRVCKHERPHTYGYVFRFKDELTIQN